MSLLRVWKRRLELGNGPGIYALAFSLDQAFGLDGSLAQIIQFHRSLKIRIK